jgi:hypothetical protein
MPSTPYYAESLAFIYRNVVGARNDTGFVAVGFMAGVESSVQSTHRYYYVVTNEHVVRDLQTVVVRLNAFPFGFKVVSFAQAEFQQDAKLDLAIAALPEIEEASFAFITKASSVVPESLNRLKIGYGTDVFMPSRVARANMQYRTRNVSVIRYGNIALIPQCEEPFYFVELRSVAGHSGSPVFIYPAPLIFGHTRKPEEDFAPMLLGINRGHIEEYTSVLAEVNGRLSKHPHLRSVTNMAISQVVPAWHIFEMLDSKQFKRQRQRRDAKLTPLGELKTDAQ